jgi:hypothetical protein
MNAPLYDDCSRTETTSDWFKNEFSYPVHFRKYAKDKELVKQATNWLTECEWRDVDAEDIMEMNPLIIIRAVQVHYHGGVSQFMEDAN